jgi:hypothetical protein
MIGNGRMSPAEAEARTSSHVHASPEAGSTVESYPPSNYEHDSGYVLTGSAHNHNAGLEDLSAHTRADNTMAAISTSGTHRLSVTPPLSSAFVNTDVALSSFESYHSSLGEEGPLLNIIRSCTADSDVTGRSGEEVCFSYLQGLLEQGRDDILSNFGLTSGSNWELQWLNQSSESFLPFDLCAESDTGAQVRFEVKSTIHPTKTIFELSANELEKAQGADKSSNDKYVVIVVRINAQTQAASLIPIVNVWRHISNKSCGLFFSIPSDTPHTDQ